MHIERVQIEEGFLDGLDVTFAPGLNIIIGERGTGKTSLIELIRFCLGVKGYTTETSRRSREHAISVLAGGQISITLSDGQRRINVTRTINDESPRYTEPFVKPIIFSQTEIETVGLQASGRLKFLDSFSSSQSRLTSSEDSATSDIQSLTAEADILRREIDELNHQQRLIPEIEKQIKELAPKELELTKISADAAKKKEQLDQLSISIAKCSVNENTLQKLQDALDKWQAEINSVLKSAPVLGNSLSVENSLSLENSRTSISLARDNLTQAVSHLSHSSEEIKDQLKGVVSLKLATEASARTLRKEVDALQEGAGATIRQGQQLRERKAHLDSLQTVLKERKKSLAAVINKRNEALDKLENHRNSIFQARNTLAETLSKKLGPRICVKAYQAGQFDTFASTISDVLRGSGLRYNELSSLLAGNISPRELLDAVESDNTELISFATGISRERATRALSQFRESDLGAIATVAVEDTVTFELLDGSTYKDIRELSTGQRCTVILPLLLQHRDRVLIVDQPEDHIDNAFIADTLIQSLKDRNPESQVLFSTHNANIPVLGDADRVIQMGSDGKRGFPILASNLEDPMIVNAITTVMEGGVDAFKRRATFYYDSDSSSS